VGAFKSQRRETFFLTSHTQEQKNHSEYFRSRFQATSQYTVDVDMVRTKHSIRMAAATQRRQFGHPQATTTTATAAAPQYAPPAASDPPRAAAAVNRGGKKRKLEELEDKGGQTKSLRRKTKSSRRKTKSSSEGAPHRSKRTSDSAGFGRVSSRG
jgi:hypothetical protein